MFLFDSLSLFFFSVSLFDRGARHPSLEPAFRWRAYHAASPHRTAMATRLQSAWRAYRGRQCYRRARERVTLLQSLVRMQQARRRYRTLQAGTTLAGAVFSSLQTSRKADAAANQEEMRRLRCSEGRAVFGGVRCDTILLLDSIDCLSSIHAARTPEFSAILLRHTMWSAACGASDMLPLPVRVEQEIRKPHGQWPDEVRPPPFLLPFPPIFEVASFLHCLPLKPFSPLGGSTPPRY